MENLMDAKTQFVSLIRNIFISLSLLARTLRPFSHFAHSHYQFIMMILLQLNYKLARLFKFLQLKRLYQY